jgi:hypothetical protein
MEQRVADLRAQIDSDLDLSKSISTERPTHD